MLSNIRLLLCVCLSIVVYLQSLWVCLLVGLIAGIFRGWSIKGGSPVERLSCEFFYVSKVVQLVVSYDAAVEQSHHTCQVRLFASLAHGAHLLSKDCFSVFAECISMYRYLYQYWCR